MDSKYDTAVEEAQVAWIQTATGSKKSGTFQQWFWVLGGRGLLRALGL